MAGRRTSGLDVREMVRRFRLDEKDRRAARELGLSRNTVAKYRQWAQGQGSLEGPELPAPGAGSGPHAAGPGDGPVRQPAGVPQSENLAQASHRQSRGRHAVAPSSKRSHGNRAAADERSRWPKSGVALTGTGDRLPRNR
jgi:hypothetical protein